MGILRDILNKKLIELDQTETSAEAYKDPSWSYRQADIVGSKRQLKTVLRLIEPIAGPQQKENP